MPQVQNQSFSNQQYLNTGQFINTLSQSLNVHHHGISTTRQEVLSNSHPHLHNELRPLTSLAQWRCSPISHTTMRYQPGTSYQCQSHIARTTVPTGVPTGVPTCMMITTHMAIEEASKHFEIFDSLVVPSRTTPLLLEFAQGKKF